MKKLFILFFSCALQAQSQDQQLALQPRIYLSKNLRQDIKRGPITKTYLSNKVITLSDARIIKKAVQSITNASKESLVIDEGYPSIITADVVVKANLSNNNVLIRIPNTQNVYHYKNCLSICNALRKKIDARVSAHISDLEQANPKVICGLIDEKTDLDTSRQIRFYTTIAKVNDVTHQINEEDLEKTSGLIKTPSCIFETKDGETKLLIETLAKKYEKQTNPLGLLSTSQDKYLQAAINYIRFYKPNVEFFPDKNLFRVTHNDNVFTASADNAYLYKLPFSYSIQINTKPEISFASNEFFLYKTLEALYNSKNNNIILSPYWNQIFSSQKK